MNIDACKDAKDAAERAGVVLSREIAEAESPVLLLLSGGSALKILDSMRPDIYSSNVTIGVLDERVSQDPAVNNYLQLVAHPVIREGIARGAKTIDTVAISGETPEQLAARFESALRDWKEENSGGITIATVGMGPDGHTFGMMPSSAEASAGRSASTNTSAGRSASTDASAGRPTDAKDFDDLFVQTPHWVAGYDAGVNNPYPLRATTTMVFAGEINTSIWYVCGAGKTDMLKRALDPRTRVHTVPARIIQDMSDVTLFTDCAL